MKELVEPKQKVSILAYSGLVMPYGVKGLGNVLYVQHTVLQCYT